MAGLREVAAVAGLREVVPAVRAAVPTVVPPAAKRVPRLWRRGGPCGGVCFHCFGCDGGPGGSGNCTGPIGGPY